MQRKFWYDQTIRKYGLTQPDVVGTDFLIMPGIYTSITKFFVTSTLCLQCLVLENHYTDIEQWIKDCKYQYLLFLVWKMNPKEKLEIPIWF